MNLHEQSPGCDYNDEMWNEASEDEPGETTSHPAPHDARVKPMNRDGALIITLQKRFLSNSPKSAPDNRNWISLPFLCPVKNFLSSQPQTFTVSVTS